MTKTIKTPPPDKSSKLTLPRLCFFISSSAIACLLFLRSPLFLFLIIALLGAFCLSSAFSNLKTSFNLKQSLPVSLLLASACGFYCYSNIVGVNLVNLNLYIGPLKALFIASFGTLASIYAFLVIQNTFRYYLRSSHFSLNQYKPLLKPFLTLFALYFLGILAITITNAHFIDDIYRNAQGLRAWDNFSRYLSNTFSVLLHGDAHLMNIAPLGQILAAAIMALASLILIYVFNGHQKITFWQIIAVLPLGLSPYFIECFSYQFDAPYMALSVLASIAPLLFLTRSPKLFIPITALCTIITCTTYQASLGIFPVAIITLTLLRWLKQEKPFKTALFAALGYLLGVIIFKIFLMREIGDYYVGTEMFGLPELIPGIISNLKTYYSLILHDFSPVWLIFIALIFASFCILTCKYSKQSRPLAIILVSASLLLSACLCFGIYIVIDNPSFTCRAMYGFGALVAIYALCVQNYPAPNVARISSFCLGWCFLSFSFIYGNALGEQISYLTDRTSHLANDLSSIVAASETEPAKIQINGTFGISPIITSSPHATILTRLIQPRLHEGWRWWFDYFGYYYNMPLEITTELTDAELPLLKETYYYNIYGTEKQVLVNLFQADE